MVLDHRLTQEPVEVAEQDSAPPRRLTQLALEVAYQQLLWRLTQEVVEGAQQVTGASLLRRLTQVVVEVGITAPVMPFGLPEFLPEPQWSPAYIAGPVEGAAAIRSSFWGIHDRVMELGRRGTWGKFMRR
mgnify:CR=1 FL=1